MKQYSVQKWAAVFQVIEAEASDNPLLSPEGMRRAKGVDKKPSHQPLPLVDPIPDNLGAEYGLGMTSCLIAWYHRDQEEKKMLRGYLERTFNNLLDIKEAVVK